MSRRDGSCAVMSTPSRRIWPPLGVSSPATRRIRVDLPQPEAPTMTSISPEARERSIPFSTLTAPKLLRRPSRTSVAILLLALGEALNEPSLHKYYYYHGRDERQYAGGHHLVP